MVADRGAAHGDQDVCIRLARPADALRYYRAAKVSTVPHLDWEANIQTGIQAAEKAAGVSISPA